MKKAIGALLLLSLLSCSEQADNKAWAKRVLERSEIVCQDGIKWRVFFNTRGSMAVPIPKQDGTYYSCKAQ